METKTYKRTKQAHTRKGTVTPEKRGGARQKVNRKGKGQKGSVDIGVGVGGNKEVGEDTR